ncbi:hypothetical protein B9N43_04830 [Denitratisoma sp. DHT3]|nr:hypothetical protein B9N43_04830 [Denitratisoma sp. DHT3]
MFGDGSKGFVVTHDLPDSPPEGTPIMYAEPEQHGNDVIDGGDGDDTVVGDGGSDRLYGGQGNDRLVGDYDKLDPQFHGDDWLEGGAGNDILEGDGGNDTLYGGAGDDQLFGDADSVIAAYHGNDVLDGQEGNDYLRGYGGNDTLLGGAGNDQMQGEAGADTLDGGEGDDVLSGGEGADTLQGGAGNDQMQGDEGADTLLGGAGDDILLGGEGDDVLEGGAGVDLMMGGGGNDLYLIRAGDARMGAGGMVEGIEDSGGSDTLRWEGVQSSGVRLEMDGSGEYLLVVAESGWVGIKNGVQGAIERIEFDDGMFDIGTLMGRSFPAPLTQTTAVPGASLFGGQGADRLTGTGGNSTFAGGQGDDTLVAAGNDNLIRYAAGDGRDQLTTGGSGNVLRLSGVSADDLKLGIEGGALVLQTGADANDALVFASFNPNNVLGQPPFERIEFDDPSTGQPETLTYAELMAKGFDITGTNSNDLLAGTNVDDRIGGGAGSDVLAGGAGNDTYYFNPGDGTDVIQDTAGLNTVVFGPSSSSGQALTAANMTVSQSLAEDGQRYLDIDFGGDRLSVMQGELNRVQVFAFADGTTLTTADLLATMPAANLLGDGADNSLHGHAGGDVLDGRGGSDTLDGGAGDDTLSGGLGADTLLGGDGADLLDGGAGDDELTGGAGFDTYRFGPGMAHDTVIEAAGEVSQLELLLGAAPSAMQSTREGDDLLLLLRSGADTLRIASYYADAAAGTNWTVRGADGAVRTMDEFLGLVGGNAASVGQFVEQFKAQWQSEWAAYYAEQGYTIGSDGVARRTETSVWQSGSTTVFNTEDTTRSARLSEYTTSDARDILHTYYGFGDNEIDIPASMQPEEGSFDYQSSTTFTGTQVRQADYGFRLGIGAPSATQPYFIANNGTSTGYRLDSGATTSMVKNPDGSIKGYWVYPAGGTTPPAQPGQFTATARYETVKLSEVRIGTIAYLQGGDDEFYASNTDGGMGNDILMVDSGDYFDGPPLPIFLYGNDGNDLLMVGGEGSNSEFTGETTYIGGRGRDTLIGTHGRNLFFLLEEDSVDTILDDSSWMENTFHDEVRFGPGVDADSLRALKSDNGRDENREFMLLLTPDGTGARFQIAGEFSEAGTGIEYVSFADGTRLTVDQLKARLDDSQIVAGSSWNDFLLSGAGADDLDGDQGNDVLAAGAGNDIYRFGRGGGQDVIDQSTAGLGDVDVLRFASDVLPSDVIIFRDEHDLYMEIADTGDLMILKSWYDAGTVRLSAVEFGDGTAWTTADLDGENILTRAIDAEVSEFVGTAGDDELRGLSTREPWNHQFSGDFRDEFDIHLFGEAGDDTLYAGNGAYTLTGGAGSDTYVFGRGDGWSRVDQQGADEGGTDIVRMGYEVAPADVSVTQQDFDLVLMIDDTDDRLIVKDWWNPGALRVKSVHFADGTVWDEAALAALTPNPLIMGTAGADVISGTAGADEIHGLAGNDALAGGAGNDVLKGGHGNDEVVGGAGFDRYVFAPGDGWDVVDQSGALPDDGDVLLFGAGIAPTDIGFHREGDDLRLSVGEGNDGVVLKDWWNPAVERIAGIEFDDGNSWSQGRLDELACTIVGTDFDDALVGTDSDDVLMGLDGEDLLSGLAGNDRLIGGPLNDVMDGGLGADIYRFNPGDGNDLLLEFDDGSTDIIEFGGSITAADLEIEEAGDGLVIHYGAEDSIAVISYDGSEKFHVGFSDGKTVPLSKLINHAPEAISAFDELGLTEDVSFSMSVPNDVFSDLDKGDRLTLSVTRSDGSGLPSWLGFDPDSGILSGTPTAAAAGWLPLSVTATDRYGLSAVVDLNLAIGRHLVGSAYGDTLTGTFYDDRIDGRGGNDNLNGGDGDDIIIGGAGYDTLSGDDGDDVFLISGSSVEYDSVNGGDGFDQILGSEGDDVFRFYQFTGEKTVERIEGGAGINVIAGSNYGDTLDFSGTELSNIARIDGGAGNDTITGSFGDDIIIGGAGYDTLAGDDGDDVFQITGSNAEYDSVNGGAGYDRVLGGAGDDVFRFYQFTGEKTVERIEGGAGTNVIAGSSYGDTLDFSETELIGIALIDGGAGNDTITGSAGDDIIIGGAGYDTLAGGAGDDVFQITGSNAEYDSVNGGAGYDRVLGGAGDDVFRFYQFTGEKTVEKIDGGAGVNVIAGSSYGDTLDFSESELIGIAQIDGGAGNDSMAGSSGDDFIHGGVGDDTLYSGLGHDFLFGNEGNDRLYGQGGTSLLAGGSGNDTLSGSSANEMLVGGIGNDILSTGAGADVLVFNAGDGQDMVTGDGVCDNTVSLGGGIRYEDLALSKSGNNLILEMGGSDQIVLKDWYAGKQSVANLQVIADAMVGFDAAGSDVLRNHKVVDFNFRTVVDAFDAARSTQPTLAHWHMADSLGLAYASAGNTSAIGGDLAYQYGRYGSFSNIDTADGRAVLGDSAFGIAAQGLREVQGMSDVFFMLG